MVNLRRRSLTSTATAIIIFVALVANQWRYLVLLHSQQSQQNAGLLGETHDARPKDDRKRQKTRTGHPNEPQEHLHSSSTQTTVVNEIIHRAFYGIGHRFHRSAAAYHLAQKLSAPQTSASPNADANPADRHQPVMTHMRFHWESCLASGDGGSSTVGKEYNVFRFLFGDDLWKLDLGNGSKYSSNSHHQPKRNMIVLRNDVPGYIAAQLYKDLKLPVDYNPSGGSSETNEAKYQTRTRMSPADQDYAGYDAILDKVTRSDVEFYSRLVDNYRFQSEIRDFQTKHKWNERPLVIGLHLRGGNGEGTHFAESGRASSFEDHEGGMIDRLVQLTKMAMIWEIKRLRKRGTDAGKPGRDEGLRPLLFIATDTGHLLPLIEKIVKQRENGGDERSKNETRAPHTTPMQPTPLPLEIVTWPQDRLPRNAGVGFDTLKGKGERCLQDWKSTFSDSLLLSRADVLIAAKRSTFTQSLPLTLGFHRNREYTPRNGESDGPSSSSGFAVHPLLNTVNSSKKRFSFCEVSEADASYMTCYASARTWLFRGEDDRKEFNHEGDDEKSNDPEETSPRMWTLSIPLTDSSSPSDEKQNHEPVEHKATVLLPDVVPPEEFELARDFLRRKNAHDSNATAGVSETIESLFAYGKSKLYKKYRNAHQKKNQEQQQQQQQQQVLPSSYTNSSWNLI